MYLVSALHVNISYMWSYTCIWASLVAQRLKRLPGMRETGVRFPGSGRSPGEGNGNPLQYSCLENPMEGGAWWATVHGVAKSRTQLSDFAFAFIHVLHVCMHFFHPVFFLFFLPHNRVVLYVSSPLLNVSQFPLPSEHRTLLYKLNCAHQMETHSTFYHQA